MFSALSIRERLILACLRFGTVRDGLWYWWLTRDKGAVVFYSLLPLPLVVLAGFARFAYVDQAERTAATARQADLTCLAENVYYEARGEPLAGQYAVAEVTLNRVASRLYPANVCGVVHHQSWDPSRRRYVGAFSWTELQDTLHRPRGLAWRRALAVATEAYETETAPQIDGALFYHTTDSAPAWARTKTPIATIGKHVFYR